VLDVCNSFGYDEFDRLTARTVTQGTVQNFTYGYDRYGNRWTQNAPQGGPSLSISFNQGNNIISTSGFANDVVGNVTGDTFHSYSYDADGNLISVDSGATATYYYDSLNQRVRIAPTRGTYEFVWDIFGRRVSNWAASSHSFVESNAYTDSSPIAIRSGGQTEFEHQNWLGTERVRTTYNGGVAISIASLPWADGHTPSGDNGDQHDFALMDRDLEDNSEHAQYRQFSTNVGRWMSPDLYAGSYDLTNPQSFNRYAYALNDPANLLDPSGLDPTCVTDPDTNNTECTSTYVSCDTDPSASGCSGVVTTPSSCLTLYACAGLVPSGPGKPTVAPNNGMPRTPQQCAGAALKKNAVALTLDVAGVGAGFLPGGDLVVAGAQATISVASGINSAANGDAAGSALGVLGLPATFTSYAAKAIGVGGKALPGVGAFISFLGAANDAYGTYQDYQACLAGHR
jgi:RHS repeat-associated protein